MQRTVVDAVNRCADPHDTVGYLRVSCPDVLLYMSCIYMVL
jgi:hypothetical protein